MTRQITLRKAAATDLAKAHAWYQEQRVGLGDEFLAFVADTLVRIEEHAEEFPIYNREFRRALVERFPYKVFFRIHRDTVIVFRVLHVASDHRGRLRNS